MLVVSIHLHSAKTGEKTLLGQAIIHNVETNDLGTVADYKVCVGNKNDAGDLKKIFHNPLRRGEVKNHARLTANVWTLVVKALSSAFPEVKL